MTKLYEPSPTPVLYVTVAPCKLMLSRVSHFPCFLQGNATPTIPHKLRHLKASAFQYGIADAAAVDGQGVVKVFPELSNKNCDHGSHIPEVQLGEVSRLKLRV